MPSRWKTLVAVALTTLLLDQWTKLLAVEHLTPGMMVAHAQRLGESTAPRAVEAHEAFLASIGWLDRLEYFFLHPATRSPCDGRAVDCRPVRVLGRGWDWRYAENKGAAWSLFARLGEGVRIPFLVGVALLSLVAILGVLRGLSDRQRPLVLALSLITGGALGNLVDRVRLGYVIDFVDWYAGPTLHWPTFNVADVAITTGVVIIAVGLLGDLRPRGSGGAAPPSDRERLASSTR